MLVLPLEMSAISCLCAPPMQCSPLLMPSLTSIISLAAPKTGANLSRTLLEGQIQNLPLINQGIPLMISTVMTMWNTTMAIHIPKCRMTIQSARTLRLLRKSLFNQILSVCHLQCLHWHRECLHQRETCHLWHRSALAKLNAARMRRNPLQLIYLPAPNVNVEHPCTPVMCMVSGDIPLSNSISKVPRDGKKLWVRPLGPHNRTHQTMFLVVSPTPLQHPVRKMCKRCARKGEQT